jgi:hypothetical protein
MSHSIGFESARSILAHGPLSVMLSRVRNSRHPCVPLANPKYPTATARPCGVVLWIIVDPQLIQIVRNPEDEAQIHSYCDDALETVDLPP